jgi:signal transduction histidine kinase
MANDLITRGGGLSVPVSLREDRSMHIEARAEGPDAPAQEALSPRDYSALLASLAHDLKNPLTRIRGRAQLLQRRLSQPEALDREQLAEELAQIEAATTRMAMLLDEVVDLSATDGLALRLARRAVDLVAIARYYAEQYQQASDRHQDPRRDTPGVTWWAGGIRSAWSASSPTSCRTR